MGLQTHGLKFTDSVNLIFSSVVTHLHLPRTLLAIGSSETEKDLNSYSKRAYQVTEEDTHQIIVHSTGLVEGKVSWSGMALHPA